MTADLKGAGLREQDADHLAGGLLGGIEAHRLRVDIDLMEEFIVVGKGECVATLDRNLGPRKRAVLLRDLNRRGKSRGGGKP